MGEPVQDPPGLEGVYVPVLEHGGLASYLPCPESEQPEGVISISAHLLQELIMDDRTGPLVALDAWPRCPHHEHALLPTTVDGLASWTCPDDESVRWRIGDLAQASAAE